MGNCGAAVCCDRGVSLADGFYCVTCIHGFCLDRCPCPRIFAAADISYSHGCRAQLVTRFGEIEEHGEDRSAVWHETLGLIGAYPIFGSGLGSYESAFLKFKTSSPALTQDYAHNDFLQYFAELGALGFALAVIPLSIVLARLRAGIRHIRPDVRWLSLACAGSAVAIGLHSFVDFNLYVPANMFTLAWILGIAAYVGRWSSRNEGTRLESTVIVLGSAKPA